MSKEKIQRNRKVLYSLVLFWVLSIVLAIYCVLLQLGVSLLDAQVLHLLSRIAMWMALFVWCIIAPFEFSAIRNTQVTPPPAPNRRRS
jgi:hypothetical protein